ncbi:hypothetical protein [Geosporobacter ferrireducens]|uniref:Uncharacterized protein n=1 Tax=Geosporobacter ferrireducens TaxID=1424294 RepID=A0A1D8GPF8_9FIRM|nr:hypothetical protein [Geosporobacter ferrireducens]AOT72846.1 hypothetical protein Gferi_26775 [Geosporobacter ferrireducens]MTI55245.1 hypothetical protein [Geosporobacter ferrireducens]
MYRHSNSANGISLYTPGFIPEELREQFGNAAELVCVQVPKVYDSCLLRICLVGEQKKHKKRKKGYCDDDKEDEGIVFDPDLRVRVDCSVESIINVRVVGLVPGSFKVILKRPVPGDPDRKIITYKYQLRILYDVVFDDCTISKDNELILRRTETVGPLYCPDTDTIIRESRVDQSGTIHPSTDEDDHIIKLEIIAEILDVQIERNEGKTLDPYDDVCFAVFTVGVFNVVKCELIVQLVIPAFGFCPPPAPCAPLGEPCEVFNAQLPPAFFPPQLDDFISGPGIDC